MQKLILNAGLLLIAFSFVLTSCTDDEPLGSGTFDTAPTITLLDEAGFISQNSEAEIGQALNVKVEIIAGTADLTSLKISENGTAVPASRLAIAGIPTANNPQLIVDKSGATFEITIFADPAITTEAAFSYDFEVTDAGQLTDAVSLTINTIDPATPLSMTISGALLNQGGPAGTGGLDLDTGESVGSSSVDAEIQDEGIDTDLAAGENWRQQISSVNDAEVRSLDASALPEGFSFDKVQSKEEVLDAFTTGLALAGNDYNSAGTTDNDGTELVSERIEIGTMFAVKRGDIHYLVRCTGVNVTPSNNDDSYEFAIKF